MIGGSALSGAVIGDWESPFVDPGHIGLHASHVVRPASRKGLVTPSIVRPSRPRRR